MDAILFALALLITPLLLWLIDAFVGFSTRKTQYTFSNNHHDDFTVLVPIYGRVSYIENAEYLAQYGDRVMFCTTGGETPEFNAELLALADKYNFRVFFAAWSNSGGAKKRATSGTIRDRLIRDALAQIETKYVVPLDADSVTVEHIGVAVGELEARNGDIASVKLIPTNHDHNWLTRLQKFEYRVAMDMRYIVPWLISGACQVAKTTVLRDVMNRHSLFFQGNDVEIGLISKSLGYKVVHIPFEVHTALPSGLYPWYRQRLAWGGGEFRLFIVNFKFILQHPFFWIYGALLVILALPLRYIAIASLSWSLAIVLGMYLLLIIGMHWKNKNAWLALLPPYILITSLVMVPLGAVWYFWMAFKDKNMGVIKPHRQPQQSNQVTVG